MKVAYEHVDAEDGRFVVHDGAGQQVVVESGKPFATDDPDAIRELDQASHAVRRVKSKKED